MIMNSGDTVVFTGTAYLDSGLQNPANLSNYTGWTFSVIDQVSQSTFVATNGPSANFYAVNAPQGIFSITWTGQLNVPGNYYCVMQGSIGATVTTFYFSPGIGRPYLEID